MATEFLSLAQKRVAIERALSQFFSGDMLQNVLQYWEKHYGNQPSFVLNRFLSEVCNTHNLKEQRKDMLRQVLQEIANVEREQRNKGKSTTQQFSHDAADLSEAFAYFLQQIMLTVESADEADFNQILLKRIQRYTFVRSIEHLDVYDPAFLQSIEVKHYSSIITVVYQCYCEFYGPPKADQLYARVKTATKQLYDGVDMHQLL